MEMGLRADPEAVRRLASYWAILEKDAVAEGFLGPNERGRILVRHLLESCALAGFLGDGSVIDVGSGAGLPGVPLACLRSSATTLLDASERRAGFLRELTRRIGVEAEVLTGRAEEVARTDLRESFRSAVCRALASPAVVLELCLPFVALGGRCAWLMAPESLSGSPRAADDGTVREFGIGLERLAGVAEALGGDDPELVALEVPGADTRRWAMIVNKVKPTPDRYPRRTGVPSRKPLG